MATDAAVMAVIRSARPIFRNSHDKIVFVLHSSFLCAGYALRATGDQAFQDDVSVSSFSGQDVGVDGWNKFEDYYGFIYSKTDASTNVLVKCLAVEDKLEIDALLWGNQNKEPLHLEISANDYVVWEATSVNYGDMYKKLGELVHIFNTKILAELDDSLSSRLHTSLDRDGGEIPAQSTTKPETSTHVGYPYGHSEGFSDLHPGTGAGFYPVRDGARAGGSMLVGPADPRWHLMGGENPDFTSGAPLIPPGARYDPIGPPGIPGFEPGRFVRQPPRRPGGDIHPDLQHFRDPPSYL